MKARGRSPVCQRWIVVEHDPLTQDPRGLAPEHDPECAEENRRRDQIAQAWIDQHPDFDPWSPDDEGKQRS